MHELRGYQKDALNAVVKHIRQHATPCVVDASVGAGKSLMMAHLAKHYNSQGLKVVVLAHTSELVQQNHDEFDGHKSICSAALGKKNLGGQTVFASEKSLYNVKNLPDFDVVMIDECDRVNDFNNNSTYMKLFSRIGADKIYVGFTGTPFRLGTGLIVGTKRFFKSIVYSITSGRLIQDGFLVPPVLPSGHVNGYDFTGVGMRAGKFVQSEVDARTDKRLTHEIVLDVIELAKNRNSVIIFGSSVEHCHEISRSLPDGEWKIITGDTDTKDRLVDIRNFKSGKYKYIISKDVLTVGFNAPRVDCVAMLRPTESRRLFTQCIGRSLRLHETKTDALLLDYAGNIERHGGLKKILENDGIEDSTDPSESTEQHGLFCPSCGFDNKLTAHRCAGCKDYYFIHKECHICDTENSITARFCRHCSAELIDPNDKLERLPSGDIIFTSDVKEMVFSKHISKNGNSMLRVDYYVQDIYNGSPCLSEFFHLSGKGAYYLKNVYKMRKDGVTYESPTAEKFMSERAYYTRPKLIRYKKAGKYFEIIEREYEK